MRRQWELSTFKKEKSAHKNKNHNLEKQASMMEESKV